MSLGIYIQVPFCQTKCTYCNFHTGVVSRDRYEPYAAAVCREVATSVLPDTVYIDTIYMGGGTPSLLGPGALENILVALGHGRRSDALEVTIEADPETVTSEKASAWLAAGFNRISLGAQSFDDRELRAAGRMHRRADTFQAMGFLRKAGFFNVSMDLIAGLPHQTPESWKQSLGRLLGIGPEHVSIYMLEIDEGSRLGKESIEGGGRYGASYIPTGDAMAEFYELACMLLEAEGYEHYEISNWALPGHRSLHNQKYWQRAPYLGFGAGAHSFDGCTRWANVHDSARYVTLVEQGNCPREQIETVTPNQALDEELFLGLRQLEGVDLARIERDYDSCLHGRIESLRERVKELRSQGVVEIEGSRLRLARDRLTVSNEVLVDLLG